MATKQMIDVFRRIFCRGRNDVFGTYYLDTGNYYVAKEPVTDEVIARHLDGKIPMGVFMLVGDKTSVGVFDVDRPDEQPVRNIVREAAKHNIPSYVERSKGKGFHVWIFFSEPVSARDVRRYMNSLLAAIGVTDVEVFPKQDSVGPNEYGNFVNCPLFGKLVPEGKTVFINGNFTPFSDQWSFLGRIQQVPPQSLEAMPATLAGPRELIAEDRKATDKKSAQMAGLRTYGLPPCAARMLREGVKDMQRSAAFRLAVVLKKAGLPVNATISVLLEWSKKNKPDNGKGIITPEEIEHQADCAYHKDYAGCGCNDAAVKPFCDANCALKRRMLSNRTGDPYEKRS